MVGLRLDRRDLLLAALLAIVSAFVTWVDARQLCQGSEAFYRSDDLWFESDTYRRYASMIDRWTLLTVNNRHPLFSLVAYPPTKSLIIAGASPLVAVQSTLAALAAVWLVVFFCLLRLVGCRRLDAMVFSSLAKASAASLFWGPVPETFSFGSLTILAPLLLVALDGRKNISSQWYVLASMLSLSLSVTNWMSGIFATAIRWPWRRAISITMLSLGAVIGLWCIQKVIVPHAPSLLGDFESNRQFILTSQPGGPAERIRALVVHALVMPDIERTSRPSDHKTVLSVNRSGVGSGSVFGRLSVGLWLVLLGLGAWASWRVGPTQDGRLVLWLLILGQIGLHVVYGDEMFLYTLHLLPLLILLVALTTLTRYRIACVTLTAILAVCTWANNRVQFERALELVQQERVVVRAR
jgi:hypothetical protein